MSDLEDDDVILDDIRALEAVLTEQKPVRIKERVKSEDRIGSQSSLYEPSTSQTLQELTAVDPLGPGEEESEGCDENEDSESVGDDDLQDLSDPEAALNLNRKIIGLLTTARKRLQLLLAECKKRQEAIDRKINEKTVCTKRTLLTIVGIPYFKDNQQFPATKNRDAKLKASRGELQVIDLPYPLRWTLKDRNALYEAIYFNAKAPATDTETDLEDVRVPWRNQFKLRSRRIPEKLVQTIRELVGPLGSKKFDWMKIAAMDFNGRHSASECRAMWQVFLHPDINKGKWKKHEDTDLKRLAEELNFQNWDEVAKRLDTSRSGYQCFIRFNTNFKNNMMKNIYWSKEEDQKLTDIVNRLRTGNFIPWGEVAKLMGNRRKQQIYMRWNYSLSPNLKKGRFTEEEDKLLLEGVAKFGCNFTKIHVALLPQRTTAQLNDHYRTMMNEKTNEWSCEDDVKLVKLFDKYGNNWAWIAKEFTNKSRVQVRHRHAAIIRYLSKGFTITTIPRCGQKVEEENTPEGDMIVHGKKKLNELSEILNNAQPNAETAPRKQPSAIDLELRDYFKGVYPANTKRGRSRKCYSNEEVDVKSRKLKVVLDILNAHLDIPDEIEDDLHLTDLEKEMLISLSRCSDDDSLKTEEQQKILEHVRRKMFGPVAPVPDDEFFVPPQPFDGKPAKPRKKKLVGINYSDDGQKYVVESTNEFETFPEIVRLIGGWDEELMFEKLKEILVCKRDFIESFDEDKDEYKEDKFSIDIVEHSLTDIVDPLLLSPSDETTSSQIQLKSEEANENWPKFKSDMYVPPNYASLLGFRSLLLAKHILEVDEMAEEEYENEEYKITEEGRKALELLEERLIKLFKFPIEFSEITPPILQRLQTNIFSDTDTCKRRASQALLGPRAKRTSKHAQVDEAESSKAQ